MLTETYGGKICWEKKSCLAFLQKKSECRSWEWTCGESEEGEANGQDQQQLVHLRSESLLQWDHSWSASTTTPHLFYGLLHESSVDDRDDLFTCSVRHLAWSVKHISGWLTTKCWRAIILSAIELQKQKQNTKQLEMEVHEQIAEKQNKWQQKRQFWEEWKSTCR